jgi:hypothetical protein
MASLNRQKMQFSYTFLLKNLPISAKISIFAAKIENNRAGRLRILN